MSSTPFKRPGHQQVHKILSKMDSSLLVKANCFFAGGTRIVLELGEYRESRDLDFLCSSRDGYRLLRETLEDTSLGAIFTKTVSLAREVRADQYGIRTFINIEKTKLKFEIIREARIDIEGENFPTLPVACLTRRHCFAEKFLANADRGMDASTLSRDLVDLAFMIEGWPTRDAETGIGIAKDAYGDSILHALARVTEKMRTDRTYRNRCIEGLAISDTKSMNAGFKALAAIAEKR